MARDLATYEFETGVSTPVAGTRDAGFPLVSPDGSRIAYISQETRQWWAMPTSGGEPTEVQGATTGGANHVGSFDAGGDLLFSPTKWGSIGRATGSEVTGTVVLDHTALNISFLGGIVASPSGAFLTISDWIGATPATSWVLTRGQTEPAKLLEGAWIHTITASGHALYIRGNFRQTQQTVAVPIDLDSGAILGGEVALGRRSYPAVVSPSGLLVYEELSQTLHQSSTLFRVNNAGEEEFVLNLPGASSEEFAISGSGTMIVVNTHPEAGALSDMYLVNLETNARTRLTQGGFYDLPAWGANDEYVYFDYQSREGRPWRIVRRKADGSGANENVSPEGVNAGDPDLSADGRILVYQDFFAGDIWGYDIQADTSFAIVEDDPQQAKPKISPDGRFVVYAQWNTPCGSIQVASVDGSSIPTEVAVSGCYPVWTSDGGHIYYETRGAISRIPVTTEPVFGMLGEAEVVYSGPAGEPSAEVSRVYFDVAADGTLYVAYAPAATSSKGAIWVVNNWFEELNRLVPRREEP